MIIHFTLNGAPQELTVNPGENVQKLLFNMGMHSVRNSDDGFGFAGSDAIIFNGNIVNASLLIAAQLEKADIRTAESLGKWNELSLVQQAMVDVGVVQSGYNDPAAALIITDLLDRIAAPTREEIDDALSGLFSRDAGWQQYYQVIELAVARKIIRRPPLISLRLSAMTLKSLVSIILKLMPRKWCRRNPAMLKTA